MAGGPPEWMGKLSFDPSIMPMSVMRLPPQEQLKKMKQIFAQFKKEILTDFKPDRNWEDIYEMWFTTLKGWLGTGNPEDHSVDQIDMLLDCGILENFLLPSIDHYLPCIAIYCLLSLANGICLYPRGRRMMWERKGEWMDKACGLLREGLGCERRWATALVSNLLYLDGPSKLTIEERKKLLDSLQEARKYKKERFCEEISNFKLEWPTRYGKRMQPNVQIDVLYNMGSAEQAISRIPKYMTDMEFEIGIAIENLQQPERLEKKECANCGEEGAKKRCPCREVYYCDVLCQRENWGTHRGRCPARKKK